MLMPVADDMAVAMTMKHAIVMMVVFMNQIGFQEQLLVTQNFRGRTIRCQAMVFVQNDDPVGNLIHNAQVMSGGHDRFASLSQLLSKFDEPGLRSRIQSVARLI